MSFIKPLSIESEAAQPDSEADMQSAERKLVERAVYDRAYSRLESFSSPKLRVGLLYASEAYFCERLQALSAGARVLEIGCGIGEHSILAAQSAVAVTGVDISAAALQTARKRLVELSLENKISLIQMDIESLSFADSSFDLVINHEAFSSLELNLVLPELKRVLKPGGRVLSLECLGHNPLFNLNRYVNYLRGKRTLWAIQHIVRQETFLLMQEYFTLDQIRYFHLLTPFLAPLVDLNSLEKLRFKLDFLDQAIIRRLPQALQRCCFKAVFELRKEIE